MKKMEYKGRQWHESCFICCTCKSNIGAASFIPSGSDIYCTGCYEDAYATKCSRCSKVGHTVCLTLHCPTIQVVTTGGVTYRNQPWHRECFTCSHCQQSLAGISFTSRQDKPYCAPCAGQLFSKKCTTCAKPITGKFPAFLIKCFNHLFNQRNWRHQVCLF